MFGKRYTLFKLFDFAVRIDLSWLLILALVIASLSAGVFPDQIEGLSGWQYALMGVAAAFGLFLSIVLHELSHSLVARRSGMPIKGITLFLFGGVAEMNDEPPNATAELKMAIAGPLASVGIMGVFLGAAALGGMWGWSQPVTAVLRWIGYINGVLVVFNMIPGYPLDGGRVLRALIWRKSGNLRAATHTASRVGSGFGLVLVGLGVINVLLMNPLGGLWWILIGFFIRSIAKNSYQQLLVRKALEGEEVRRFMSKSPVSVAPSLSLGEFVEEYVYRHHHKLYPVVEQGRLVGCVTTRDVKAVAREAWSRHRVEDVAQSCSESNSIAPDTDAIKALETMNRHQVSRLMVTEGETLLGVIGLKDLLRFLAVKLDLEGDADLPSHLAA
jgi:Zn-dependent protease/CBS domain-containing protein